MVSETRALAQAFGGSVIAYLLLMLLGSLYVSYTAASGPRIFTDPRYDRVRFCAIQ
jgi:hypothetical protein